MRKLFRLPLLMDIGKLQWRVSWWNSIGCHVAVRTAWVLWDLANHPMLLRLRLWKHQQLFLYFGEFAMDKEGGGGSPPHPSFGWHLDQGPGLHQSKGLNSHLGARCNKLLVWKNFSTSNVTLAWGLEKTKFSDSEKLGHRICGLAGLCRIPGYTFTT